MGKTRDDDAGLLWEHLVLEALIAAGEPIVHFWRDKQHREVDFVVPRRGGAVDALECKWKAANFEPKGLLAFRERYPRGRNFVVAPLGEPHQRAIAGMDIRFVRPTHLREQLVPHSA